MIVDLPPSKRSARELVAREVAAFVGASLLYPFGIARRRTRPTPRKAEGRTVVLVHGYLANRSTLLPLHAYLKLRGIGPVLTFDYPSSDGIERSARALREFCRRARARRAHRSRVPLARRRGRALVAAGARRRAARRSLHHAVVAASRDLRRLLGRRAHRARAAARLADHAAARGVTRKRPRA